MPSFPQFYNKIFDYSLKKGTHIKFIDMLKSSPIKYKYIIPATTKHIYNEMPIRLAKRVTDLNNLPFGLAKNHSINKIREWYLTSFLELTHTKEPVTETEIIEFKNTIEKIYDRHSSTLITISKGLYELKMDNKISDIEAPMIQTFLNKFHTNRTEIRILLEQYLSFFEKSRGENHFGIVNLKSDIKLIIINTIEDIQSICDKNRLNLELSDIIKLNFNSQIIIPCIDHYLRYILFELIKNSIEAIKLKSDPRIEITVREIDENWILIKIEDNGIGIKDTDKDKIWYYSFTTSPIDSSSDIIENNDFSITSPLSGFGYGLPISDIYINFFNSSSNNIKIDSIYKKGTIIYVYLRKYRIESFRL